MSTELEFHRLKMADLVMKKEGENIEIVKNRFGSNGPIPTTAMEYMVGNRIIYLVQDERDNLQHTNFTPEEINTISFALGGYLGQIEKDNKGKLALSQIEMVNNIMKKL